MLLGHNTLLPPSPDADPILNLKATMRMPSTS